MKTWKYLLLIAVIVLLASNSFAIRRLYKESVQMTTPTVTLGNTIPDSNFDIRVVNIDAPTTFTGSNRYTFEVKDPNGNVFWKISSQYDDYADYELMGCVPKNNDDQTSVVVTMSSAEATTKTWSYIIVLEGDKVEP